MATDPLSALGPSDSGLLQAPNPAPHVGGVPPAGDPPRKDASMERPSEAPHEPPAAAADANDVEASLKEVALPSGLLGRLHGVVDEF